jgi:hypothetical protein
VRIVGPRATRSLAKFPLIASLVLSIMQFNRALQLLFTLV